MSIQELIRYCSTKSFPKDEIIVVEGEPGDEMYIILSGKVNVLLNSIDGLPIQVAQLDVGQFFGEMCLLDEGTRNATVQAVEDTTLLCIKKNNFEQVIRVQPNLVVRIINSLSTRLKKMNEEISRIQSGSAQLKCEQVVDSAARKKAHKGITGVLFPENHKSYELEASSTDEHYLFDKKVQCPVCDKNFSSKTLRSHRLNLNNVEADFRKRYEKIEPLWYMVWVCPQCFYADFYLEFGKLAESVEQKLRQRMKARKDTEPFNFSNPRHINEVFPAYYLLLDTFEACVSSPAKLAKTWLCLSWLYDDVEDQEMSDYASRQALDYYEKAYDKNVGASIAEEQRLVILLGELHLRHNSYDEARQFFLRGITRQGSDDLNQHARQRITDLKELIK
ncbi:DUF2225 domain-containing protein [Heliorestis acidaminivorans]|uniref:DUF2225 domain-containing protein n=1 Tax=Heliorestis acidaminivorans TaxID=553427 RepID=A0A6I0F0U4_9FIRM|nr:DUF2225 domain-containing protein [Heliorestis acidaminivorans]KAB2951974.1 DUF2225 domain-containing protein [Heliorestis acidaminivorans]